MDQVKTVENLSCALYRFKEISEYFFKSINDILSTISNENLQLPEEHLKKFDICAKNIFNTTIFLVSTLTPRMFLEYLKVSTPTNPEQASLRKRILEDFNSLFSDCSSRSLEEVKATYCKLFRFI